MKAIAGAVVVLAGAVLVAAGTVVDGMMRSANRVGDPGVFVTMGGVCVGVVGLAVFALGLAPEPKPPPQAQDRASGGP